MSKRRIEFPFEHPAAGEVVRLFHALKVSTESAYRALPRRDRYLYDIVCFENDVMNGGFDQYFYTISGDHAAECMEALKTIGAKKSLALLLQVCRLFPDGKPNVNHIARERQLLEIAGQNGLDDHLASEYELETDLYQRLLAYYRGADPKAR